MGKDIKIKQLDYFQIGVPELCKTVSDYCDVLEKELGEKCYEDTRFLMSKGAKNDYVSAIWIMIQNAMITNVEEQRKSFCKIVNFEADAQTIQLSTTDYIRKSVITRVYFLCDNFLQNYVKHLTGSSSKNVYKNANEIEKKFNIDESEKDVFLALGNMRNGFHNDGIHKNKDEKLIVNDREYNFVNNEYVPLGWDDISNIIHQAIYTMLKWSQLSPSNIVVPNYE